MLNLGGVMSATLSVGGAYYAKSGWCYVSYTLHPEPMTVSSLLPDTFRLQQDHHELVWHRTCEGVCMKVPKLRLARCYCPIKPLPAQVMAIRGHLVSCSIC